MPSLFFLQVTRLCDLSVDGDTVTSVSWNERVGVVFEARNLKVGTGLFDHCVTLWAWRQF